MGPKLPSSAKCISKGGFLKTAAPTSPMITKRKREKKGDREHEGERSPDHSSHSGGRQQGF